MVKFLYVVSVPKGCRRKNYAYGRMSFKVTVSLCECYRLEIGGRETSSSVLCVFKCVCVCAKDSILHSSC